MKNDSLAKEQELLRSIARGDESAFSIVFAEYWPLIYGASIALTKSNTLSEDITQEVFARLWEGRTEATQIRNLKSYLFISARNLIINRLQRIKVEAAYQNYILHAAAENPSEVPSVEARALKETLQALVERLPPQQQKVFVLSREENLSYEQIAQQMQISRHTVKEYMMKALAKLRKQLQEYHPFPIVILSAAGLI